MLASASFLVCFVVKSCTDFKSDTLSPKHAQRARFFFRDSSPGRRLVSYSPFQQNKYTNVSFPFFFKISFKKSSPRIVFFLFENVNCYTNTRLCLLSFRIFPSRCLAVAIPFLGRLPGRKEKDNGIRNRRKIKSLKKGENVQCMSPIAVNNNHWVTVGVSPSS